MEFFTFLVVYSSVAWLLFKMPNLFHCPVAANELHKKHFLIISHRGGSGEHPENTLKAFKSTAWADVLELDVVFSADKQIVVSHDDCIERLCGKKEFISKMKFQDLPKYKKEFFSHFLEENFRSDESGRFCLLEDVFKECPDSIICVDLKTPSDEAIQVMAKLIEKYNRSKLTVKINRYSGLMTLKPIRKSRNLG
jgi:glycerophosphoryl diester phosphodiesterase